MSLASGEAAVFASFEGVETAGVPDLHTVMINSLVERTKGSTYLDGPGGGV